MARILIVSLSAFIFQLLLAAINVPLGLSGATVLMAPAALALVTTEFSIPQALASMLLLGFLLDAWLGAPVGLIMCVLALLWMLALICVNWLGKPDFFLRVLFIFFFALAFRVLVALALGIAGGSQGNLEWVHLFGMPVLDVGFGLIYYKITLRTLTLLGLCEIREDTSQRLSRRSPRIRLE